jgi:hypothetical protein
MKKIALISCVKKKLAYPAPAKELYVSTLFNLTYAYAQRFDPAAMYVLSAKYGLVAVDKRIEPYELTLNTMRTDDVRAWAARVLTQLRKVTDLERDHFIILAGHKYRRFLVPEMSSYEVPLEGLPFGKQLGHLKRLLETEPLKRPGKKRRAARRPASTVPAASPSHETCERLHRLAWDLPRHRFPFDGASIPANGIYLLFERGQRGHGAVRIVRVGTHTGKGQLRSRLGEHFLTENKDRSIFRKNIGRALLARDDDPFLTSWEIDLTKKESRALYGASVDLDYQARIEAAVSNYIRRNFSFAVVEVTDKEERLTLESRLVSAVSLCKKCHPSPGWLGLQAPNRKIRASGLWQVQHLYKTPAGPPELALIEKAQAGPR